MSLDLTAELRALGVALGVLDGDGDLRPDWFSDPLKHIRRILLDPDQRASLLDATGRSIMQSRLLNEVGGQ